MLKPSHKFIYINLCTLHSVTKTCKHLGSHNAVKHNTVLGSVFLEDLMMTFSGQNMSPWQIYYFIVYK